MKKLIYCCVFFANLSVAQQTSSETFLSELIQIESLSGCEIEAARKIESWALENNLYVTNFENNEDSKNIVVSLYPLDIGKPNIVFSSHLDVVPAENEQDWKFPPFAGAIANDTVWGRGALDCKGLAVMQLYALKRFKDSLGKNTFPYNVSFLGLVEEETQSKNGAALIASKFLDLIHPVVIFGEGGAGMQDVLTSRPETPVFGISVADKSSLWLKLEAEGGGFGHGAVPSDLYANKRLIKALIRLLDEKKSIRFHPIVRTMFDRIGEMEGGMQTF
jgi:carboxypeptidase PM20D1